MRFWTSGAASIAAIALLFSAGNTTQAATCSGPVHSVSVSTNIADTAACLVFDEVGGDTNGLTGNNDEVIQLASAHVMIDEVQTSGAGPVFTSANGFLTIGGAGVNFGTWSLNPALALAGWTDFVLGLKDGNSNPAWAAFTLGANAFFNGTWFASAVGLKGGGNFDLSHARLYAIAGVVSQVPLPPALILFGTALVGMTILGRRRRRMDGIAS